MDHINSEMEIDQLFAETDTLYDFFELEETWEAMHQSDKHAFKHFLDRLTKEDNSD